MDSGVAPAIWLYFQVNKTKLEGQIYYKCTQPIYLKVFRDGAPGWLSQLAI